MAKPALSYEINCNHGDLEDQQFYQDTVSRSINFYLFPDMVYDAIEIIGSSRVGTIPLLSESYKNCHM